MSFRYLIISLTVLAFVSSCSRPVSIKKPDSVDGVPGSAKGDILTTGTVEKEKEDEPKQKSVVKNWFTKDSGVDGVEGVSADLAYKDLKPGKMIVVAVIDGGVDTLHEDLQGKIWVNPGESGVDAKGNDKASNGTDDDSNGYIDDVNGWNFLGTIGGTTLEITREYVRMKELEAKGPLSPDQKIYLEHLASQVEAEREGSQKVLDKALKYRSIMESEYQTLSKAKLIEVAFEKVDLALVEAIVTEDKELLASKTAFVTAFKEIFASAPYSTERLNARIKQRKEQLEFYYSTMFEPRAAVLKDDPNNFNEVGYGSNDVKGPDASHGTHVAGIIGAVRGNSLGIDGVAEDVRIMGLRAVPNGDEYDKDVANAVRYAADNGAHIINMSFGKSYSPKAKEVRDAFFYAASKNVLIIHAAGNSSQDNDVEANYPFRYTDWGHKLQVPGWIEVGASAADKGLSLTGAFSNYGKNSVDVFAPGVAIESTVPYDRALPDSKKYDTYSGTSMASPTTAGVAALVLSQYPNLKATQLKEVIEKSVVAYPSLEVQIGNDPANMLKILFERLSATGGVVNTKRALEEAANVKN